MKQVKNLLPALVISIVLGMTACKNKSSQDTKKVDADTTTTRISPVEIETDDVLIKGAKDATKDYPTVTASVSGGEITLTGDITRDKLPKLIEALNSLHPKKINNNLIIN